ncbi:SprT family zinc-dependent metalloprotease [Zoogloeaceae bacterium G21618-S1]|nr:SprT family zinc-dependent metalloprotease [Zoogloeaceae bacterium G21618-S1]
MSAALRSQHQIHLLGRPVGYHLRRSARRTLGLTIDGRGLSVAAPLRAPHSAVEAFLQAHDRWVLDKLTALAARPQAAKLVVVDGVSFPLMGAPCRLTLSRGRAEVRWMAADLGDEARLMLRCTVRQSPTDRLKRALQARALAYFEGRVAEFALRIGVPVPPVGLTQARTRWGSCSARGIRLHWRLIHLSPDLIDYVVAHEVAHRVHMNHSPRFWALVAQVIPDVGGARLRLRQLGRALPEFIDAAEPAASSID